MDAGFLQGGSAFFAVAYFGAKCRIPFGAEILSVVDCGISPHPQPFSPLNRASAGGEGSAGITASPRPSEERAKRGEGLGVRGDVIPT